MYSHYCIGDILAFLSISLSLSLPSPPLSPNTLGQTGKRWNNISNAERFEGNTLAKGGTIDLFTSLVNKRFTR